MGRRRSRGGRVLGFALWTVLTLIYVAVAFAYGLPQNFESRSPLYVRLAWVAFAVRTVELHVGLLASGLVVAAIAARRWRAVVVALPLTAVLAVVPLLAAWLPKTPPTAGGETLRLMSLNLRYTSTDTTRTLAAIRDAEPDVVLVQEYTPRWQEALRDSLASDYPHAIEVPRRDQNGIALFSSRELQMRDVLRLHASKHPQIRASVLLEGRKLVVYGVHLIGPHVFSRLESRRPHFAELLERVAAESAPVVIGGDFNFTDSSPQASALRQLGFRQSHSLAGRGLGSTWPADRRAPWTLLPGLRLDHFYLGPGIVCLESRTAPATGSDHRPIIARIGIDDRGS